MFPFKGFDFTLMKVSFEVCGKKQLLIEEWTEADKNTIP
jgi:hypothetical protein